MLIPQLGTIAWPILFYLAFQDPFLVAPEAYKLQYENDWVRVVRVHYAPHEKLPSHDHPKTGTVYVYLSDSGPVRFTHTGTEKFTVDRPAVKAGGFRLGKAVSETHTVESLSDEPTDLLRVELKTAVPDAKGFTGRFPLEPHSTDRSFHKTRFENEQVRISQITCAAQNPCTGFDATATPSLVVPITQAQCSHFDKTGRASILKMESGGTLWMETGAQLQLENTATTAVEFIRIDLKTAPQIKP